MKLKVVLEPSEEGGYSVYVPTLPGCISEGDTKEEALSTSNSAWFRMWLNVDRFTGRCAGTVTLRVRSATRFCNRMWLPRCLTTTHPSRWRALRISR